MTTYTEVKNSVEFKNYCENGDYSIDMIWTLYKVIPFTQLDKISKKLVCALRYSQECGDSKCEKFISKMMNSIQK
jgi:hypothetical protein